MRNRDALREYVTGSLWVMPGVSAVLALLVGFILSRIPIGPGSPSVGSRRWRSEVPQTMRAPC